MECAAAGMLRLEILEAGRPLHSWQTNIYLEQTEDLLYLHRAFLLPGRYTLRAYADSARAAVELVVPDSPSDGDILAGEADLTWNGAHSPFVYDGIRVLPSETPKLLTTAIPDDAEGQIVWRVRQGSRNVAHSKVSVAEIRAKSLSTPGVLRVDLPMLEPGAYIAEVQGDGFTRTSNIRVSANPAPRRSQVVYSANLGRGADLLAWGK